MKKTALYFVVLAVLGFGVWFFLFRNSNVFGNKEAGFTIKDTASIGKIFIANTSGRSVLLERTDSGWRVNKQYKIFTAPLQLLLVTLHEQEALYPVNDAAQDHVIKSLASNAVKVEVYNRSGDKMAIFYVGEEAHNFEGTHMLMESAQKPYVVKIANFSGYLRPRYSPYLKDWRDRGIVNLQPDEVKSVTVQFPDHPINSFTITQENGKVSVVTDSDVMKANAFNQRRANLYLTFLSNINCEGYVNGAEGLDSVLKIMPKKCSIDVVSQSGEQKHIDVYWMPINRRSKNLLTSDRYTPDQYDPDRFYAVINNNRDTAMIQNFVFEKLWRNGYEFYQPDGSEDKPQKHALTHPVEPQVKK